MSIKARRTVSINPDVVEDPQAAMRIALEILESRVQHALINLKKGYKIKFQEDMKEIKRSAIRAHRLGALVEPYTSQQFVAIMNKSAVDSTARVKGDNGDGCITIEGSFDFSELSKYMLWG